MPRSSVKKAFEDYTTQDWDVFRKKFLKNNLRRATFRWPAATVARRRARVGRFINPATERLCWFGQCARCPLMMLEKELELDHAEPVVPILSSVRPEQAPVQDPDIDMGSYVRRMFPEPRGLQSLCKLCHAAKTQGENSARREAKEHERVSNRRVKG